MHLHDLSCMLIVYDVKQSSVVISIQIMAARIRFDFGCMIAHDNRSFVEAILNEMIREIVIMSQHASFKSASKIQVKRNVLKRFERIDLLREQGKWKEGDRGQGLPKTRTQ
jgi:small basic protein (TIGR04137 family)